MRRLVVVAALLGGLEVVALRPGRDLVQLRRQGQGQPHARQGQRQLRGKEGSGGVRLRKFAVRDILKVHLGVMIMSLVIETLAGEIIVGNYKKYSLSITIYLINTHAKSMYYVYIYINIYIFISRDRNTNMCVKPSKSR